MPQSLPSSQRSSPEKIKRIDYTRPWLYPKQEHAIFYPRDVNGKLARYSLIEAGTKTGKTVGSIAWLFEQALFGPRGNYWWIAPVSSQAKIAYTRMKDSYPTDFLKSLLTPTPTLTLPGGQIIWFRSGEDPDNLYGEDVQAAVIDEASRLREEAWHAVRSTLTATRGPCRFIGNVKGRKNWFYAMSRKAEAGTPGMAYFKIVAADAVAAGVLSDQEIADAKRDLPENVFRELYLAEPTDDGGNPFGMSAIADCVSTISTGAPVVWGWDLAKHVDWTVGIALDQEGRVCKIERFQMPWDETMSRIKLVTGRTPALIDSTGVGDPILELLQKTTGSSFEGYTFSAPSKQKLMEGLAVAIQQKTITFPPGAIRQELENFEFQYTRTGVRYSAPEGFHDDCVCSLALAVMHKEHAMQPMIISQDFATQFAALTRRR